MTKSGWPNSILMAGCGNMGGAMLKGWLAGGFNPSCVAVIDPVVDHVAGGVSLYRHAKEVENRHFDAVLLGVKPQILGDVAPGLTPFVGPDTALLSILAGVEITSLAVMFDARAIVRIMPNLAASIGKAPVALCGKGLTAPVKDAVTRLMKPLGQPEWFDDESLFDAITALVGSGPAFVYRFIDALAAGGAALGLDPAQAVRLAIATVEGAAGLAASSPHLPGDLANQVASPGGTTRAGLDVLDADGKFADCVARTLDAAATRGREMALSARENLPVNFSSQV